MTTTRTAVRGTTPTTVDITEAVDKLRAAGGNHYAYTVGYLGSLLERLAEEHTRCRQADCGTCWHFRRGLALLNALDDVEHLATGGA